MRPRQLRILLEDRAFEALQRWAWLQAEHLVEHSARFAVPLECVGLPAGTVESEHQLAGKAFAKRMLAHQILQLADELRSGPARQIRLDPRLDRRQAQLFEAFSFCLREPVIRKIRKSHSAPESERLGEDPSCFKRPSLLERGTPAGKGVLEAVAVDSGRRDVQDIAGRMRVQHIVG